jgi:triacylglycerol esterase/lipase EstA (alpha/beta hydrolase family)
VILVHGILGQRHLYWNVMKRRLGADGFRYHECIIPYGLLGDLRIAARYLRDKVLATLRGDEAERVDLVCHSAGGLVARYYMMYLGGAKRVGRVVTMGTPHQGTYFAYTMGLPWIVNVARQTRPGSHFLDEISGPGAVPQGVRFYNLWSRTDGLVLPSHNSKLAGSEAVHIPLATHWSFLWRKDVYDAIHAALEDRLVTTHGKAVVLPRPDATAPTGAPSHAPRD